MPNRIRIEVLGNPDRRHFHVNTQVSSEKLRGSTLLGAQRNAPFHVASFDSDSGQDLTDDTKVTIMRFYDIDGIAAVGVDVYQIDIERAPAFEWEELEPAIIEAIKATACWTDEEVTIEYLFYGKVYPDGVSREIYEMEMDRQLELELEASRHFG